MLGKKKKRSKFGNVKVDYDGYTFDSKAECKYYKLSKLLKNVTNLKDRVLKIEVQKPVFKYNVEYKAKGKTVSKKESYTADFSISFGDGRTEIVDVKGVETAIFKRKKKIVEALFEVKIIIIDSKTFKRRK